MSNKSETVPLALPRKTVRQYEIAAKRLKLAFKNSGPKTEELIANELSRRTPAGIVENSEQGNWTRRRSGRGGVVVR